MAYQITEGVGESELPAWLHEAAKKYGTFEDGRVDYTNSKIAPIVMCTPVCQNKILLVKRGHGLADANGYWSTINGFIDVIKPVRKQAAQEMQEELGIMVPAKGIRVGASYTVNNPKEKRAYIVFPCLIALQSEPKVVLNEENTEFAWIKRDKLSDYHILDDLPEAIDSALKLL